MIFEIDGRKYDDIYRIFDYISCNADDCYYDNIIDEENDPVYVYGESFEPSIVMKELSPVTYRCVKSDIDEQINKEYFPLLDNMEKGDSLTIWGFKVIRIK